MVPPNVVHIILDYIELSGILQEDIHLLEEFDPKPLGLHLAAAWRDVVKGLARGGRR